MNMPNMRITASSAQILCQITNFALNRLYSGQFTRQHCALTLQESKVTLHEPWLTERATQSELCTDRPEPSAGVHCAPASVVLFKCCTGLYPNRDLT